MIAATFEDTIKMLPRGVLTVPIEFRKALNLTAGGFVRITKDKWRLIIEPVRTLAYSARSYTDDDLKGFFELDDKESKTLRQKGIL